MQRRFDIVDTALSVGNLSKLTAALGAAGLLETLKNEGPFTVFAPTDYAFAKIPPQTLSDLLQPENKEELTAILTYHVVPGRVAWNVEATNGMIHVIDTVLMPATAATT